MAGLNLEIPKTKLPNGALMPVIGYGLGTRWSRGKKNGESPKQIDETMIEATVKAINMGYYHLDGAESYTTDPEIGAAIKKSKLPRDTFFVTTKLKPDNPESLNDIRAALDKRLNDLSLDYVDLYLLHEPFYANGDKTILQKTWADFEALQHSGKAKAIGVSNCRREHIEAILETATIPPVVNQIEYHPYLQHEDLVPYLKSKNIQVTCYGSLTPMTKAHGKSEEMDRYLDSLARKYYVTPGEILLRWCIDQDVIPITTTDKEIRMSDYLRTITFKLTPKEFDEIKGMGKKTHYRSFWKDRFDTDDRN